MTIDAPTRPLGLFGDGRPCGSDGLPTRPGGSELTEALLDLADFPDGALVVDVGCGAGASVAAMMRRGLVVIGVDRTREALDMARRTAVDATFVLGDADALPVASGGVDGLLAEGRLSAAADRKRILAEWYRVLRPGGRLAISDVYRRAFEAEPSTATGGGAPFETWQCLSRDLAAAGFRIEWFEDRSDVLAPWVGRSVFSDGAHDAPWGEVGAVGGETMRTARPGYYLALADRPLRSMTEG